MLETCTIGKLRELARSKGKNVSCVQLFGLFPSSLIQVTTSSGNIYLIETVGERQLSGLQLNVARINRPQARHPSGHVKDSFVKFGVLRVGEPFVYSSKGVVFTTNPIVLIRELLT